MASPAEVLYIVGDIGGTNSRLRAFSVSLDGVCELGPERASPSPQPSPGGGPIAGPKPAEEAAEPRSAWSPGPSAAGAPVCGEALAGERTYPSGEHASLGDILELFLRDEVGARRRGAVQAAVLAVAGPVSDNVAELTNLRWRVDGAELERRLGLRRVVLINDFAGAAFGLLSLRERDVHVLNAAACTDRAPIAVIGAGTGLGEAYLTHNGAEYDVWSSEGGHADFAPRNRLELDLVEYMSRAVAAGAWKRIEGLDRPAEAGVPRLADDAPGCVLGATYADRVVRVSTERVVSGTGLPHIYNFLKLRYPARVSAAVEAELERTHLHARVICQHAERRTDGLCELALDIFVSCFGSEAGNLALKTMPFGGVYVCGGVAPKIIELLRRDNKFCKAMFQKGRMSAMLQARIPVYVVKEEAQVGLLGSRTLARRVLRRLAVEAGAVHSLAQPLAQRSQWVNTPQPSSMATLAAAGRGASGDEEKAAPLLPPAAAAGGSVPVPPPVALLSPAALHLDTKPKHRVSRKRHNPDYFEEFNSNQ